MKVFEEVMIGGPGGFPPTFTGRVRPQTKISFEVIFIKPEEMSLLLLDN